MDKVEYRKKLYLSYQQMDFTGKWKMSDLFSQLADVATIHAEQIGAWKPDMIHQYGWILSKMRLRMTRPLKYEETITLTTWPGQGTRVIFPRFYTIDDENGHRCLEAISQWTLFDLQNRRIVIPSRIGIKFPENLSPALELNLDDSFCDEYEYQKIEDRQVRYSDIDTNQHFNNARYMEWVCDLLDTERFKSGFIADMAIYFKKETAPGEILTLEKKEDGDLFYVRGTHEGDIHFLVEGQWKKY